MSKAQPPDREALLARFLQELREQAGLSQRALGDKLGTSQTWIYNHEKGLFRLPFEDFIRWCEACEVQPETEFRRFMQSLAD